MNTKNEEATGREMRFFPVDNPEPKVLSQEQIARYNREGVVFPLDVFSPDEIAGIRADFEDVMRKARAKGHDNYSMDCWHGRLPFLFDLVQDRRILDYVEDLLGPDLICWATHFFSKEAGDTRRVSWHQDAPYWYITPTRTVTVWLAIDDAGEENGAMRVIPGSHLHGEIPSVRSKGEEQNVLSQTVVEPEKWGSKPISIELEAGQVSMHSDLLLHGSEPNPSNRRRCGLTMRFAPPEVRRLHPDFAGPYIIARGSDPSGHWPAATRPPALDIPHA